MAEKDEFAAKQKEVEQIWNPIATKMYQQGGEPNMNNSRPSAQPTIEEVD